MPFMKATRVLRAEPDGATLNIGAKAGAEVEILETRGNFTKVRLIEEFDRPAGWVSSDAIDTGAVPIDPAIDKAAFAMECWLKSLFFGVNAHYLMAVAELRSRVRADTVGNLIGPYRLTQAEWNSGVQTFNLSFQPNHINDWLKQVLLFALLTQSKLQALTPANGPRPSAMNLLLAQSGNPPPTEADFKKAIDATSQIMLQVGVELLDGPTDTVVPTNGSNANVDFTQVAQNRRQIAELIVNRFAAAGFGKLQQVAGLANAIAELNLNPKAHNTAGEDSVGLFQLNRIRGLGVGFSVAALMDPATNVDIIIKEAKKFAAFANAPSLRDAVDVFVRKVERPANQDAEVNKRFRIAQALVI